MYANSHENLIYQWTWTGLSCPLSGVSISSKHKNHHFISNAVPILVAVSYLKGIRIRTCVFKVYEAIIICFFVATSDPFREPLGSKEFPTEYVPTADDVLRPIFAQFQHFIVFQGAIHISQVGFGQVGVKCPLDFRLWLYILMGFSWKSKH